MGANLYRSVFSSPPDTWLCCSRRSDISFALAAVNEWITRRPLSEGNNNAINASSYAMGSLRNAEIIKALGMFAGVRNGWLGNRDNMLKHQSVASDRAGGIVAASRFIRMSFQVLMLATGAYLAIQDLISPGTMIAASIIMGRALAPVELAVSQWRNLIGARDAYGRVKKFIEQYPEDRENGSSSPSGASGASRCFH